MLLSILSCLSVLFFTLRMNTSTSFLKYVSLIWLFILALYWFQVDLFVPISAEFDMIFVVFFWSLNISYALFYLFLRNVRLVSFRKLLSLKHFYFLSIMLSAVSILKFFYYFFLYHDFVAFRAAFIDEGLSLYVGISFPLSSAAYFLARQQKDAFYTRIFMFLLISLALISTSKIFIIIAILFVSGFGSSAFKLSIKKFLGILIFGFGLFSLVHIAMGKIAGSNDFPLYQALLFTFSGYLLGGFAVFQLVLDGAYSASPSASIITYLTGNNNLIITLANEDGWIRTGDWVGNVISGFSPWYIVSGAGGVVFIGGLIGAIHGVINAFSRNSLSFRFLRVFSIYPLSFFVFSDTYISASLMWVAFFICSFIISLIKLQKKAL